MHPPPDDDPNTVSASDGIAGRALTLGAYQKSRKMVANENLPTPVVGEVGVFTD
jgi:hypothetical protein